IAGFSVAPQSADNDLLLFLRIHEPLGWPDFQAGDRSVLGARPRSTIFEPLFEHGVGAGIDGEPLAAAMLHGQRRLLKNHAALRIGWNHAPAFGALNDLNIIKGRIESTQTQLEAVLAMLPAMTGALIAPSMRQN